MICKTIEQMQRVANAGAIKMHRQGYTYSEYAALSSDTTTCYEVLLPAEFCDPGAPRTAHYVSITPDADGSDPLKVCTCQFYTNHNFGFDTTCKHIEYVLAEESDRAQTEAQELAEAEREDWQNMATADERAHAWSIHNRPCHLYGMSGVYAQA